MKNIIDDHRLLIYKQGGGKRVYKYILSKTGPAINPAY